MLSPEQQKKLRKLKRVYEENNVPVSLHFDEVEKSIDALEKKIEGINPEKGEKGDRGEKGEKGDPGKDGKNGKDGRDGVDGIDGKDGKDGKDGEMGMIDEATIAYLEDEIKRLDAKLQEAKQGRTGWGAHPITIMSQGTVIDKNVRFINFGSNMTVTRSADGILNINSTGTGGGGTGIGTWIIETDFVVS